MSIRKALAKMLVLSVLNFGALLGVPMRPDEIEKLMDVMTRVRIVRIIKKEDPP